VGLLIRFAVTFVAVFVTSRLLPDLIQFSDLSTLLLFAIVLAVINALVRPLVLLLTCPIQILTLGLAALVVNALLFLLAASLVPGVQVDGFWNAFVAALIVSVVGWGISLVVHD